MYQVWIAYLLWLVGGFGVLGLHRFYMKKIPTGVLWILTGGLGFMGALYDFFTMSQQVLQANARDAYLGPGRGSGEVIIKREKEPLERTILRLAQQNSGRVSAVQVAAGSDWSLDEAQKSLDNLVRRGACEMRVAKSGTVVYVFSGLDPSSNQDFEV